mmetsp:Transcript_1851/g.6434  ORF Transcript_1851/g.6434 Transcript_1851/m.6434 type:complete len:286 (-) Transcript_1851:351-1208(-)
MSVAKSTIASAAQKASNAASLRCCLSLPCRHLTGTPGRSFLKAASTNCTCRHEARNTRVLAPRCARTKDHSTSSLSPSITGVHSCVRLRGVAVALSACTERYSGSERLSRARSFTDRVWVAEKRRVWRDAGRFSTMALSVRWNPRSSILSASSRTSTRRPEQSNEGVSSMCWSRRPGVHTSTFTPATRAFSASTSLPPISSAALRLCLGPTRLSCWKIWDASSRVGDTTSAPTPSIAPHRARNRDSRSGTRNARVLPEPVLAAPSTSRPHSACGMVARCTAVMSV